MENVVENVKKKLTQAEIEANEAQIKREVMEKQIEIEAQEKLLKIQLAQQKAGGGSSSSGAGGGSSSSGAGAGGGGPSKAAKPEGEVEQKQQDKNLEDAIKQLGMLHKPAEILLINSILYYGKKQIENLLDYNAAIKKQLNALDNAEKNTQIYWDYMYAMLTKEVNVEIQTIPLNHEGPYAKVADKPLPAKDIIKLYKTTYDLPQSDKQHIADLYMNYNLEIDRMKIHFMYPFLSLDELDEMDKNSKL